MSEMLALPPAEDHTVIQGEVVDRDPAHADTDAPVYNITSLGEKAPDAEQAEVLTADTQPFPYITPDGQEGVFNPTKDTADKQNHDRARSYETYSDFSADLGYVAVSALANDYLRRGVAETTKTAEQRQEQEIPSAVEIQDGLTNDIIADVLAEEGEVTALDAEQRQGIARRLYGIVASMPGGKEELGKIRGLLRNSDEALQKNDNLWGDEREWLSKLQETAERLLGGLPSFDNAERIKNFVPQFYAYSEKNMRREGKQAWNSYGTLRSLDGMRRVIELKKEELHRKYDLAA